MNTAYHYLRQKCNPAHKPKKRELSRVGIISKIRLDRFFPQLYRALTLDALDHPGLPIQQYFCQGRFRDIPLG
jgi:hypothetical protein